MSNLVIVAIPDENDRVWKVSSEKIPHLTLLYLGDVDQVNNVDQIVQFVEHAANQTLNRFYLPVDRRGELGDDKADVLFFKRNRWDFKAVRDFRVQLLKDNNIRTAYDAASQFAGPWNPHLTLGYPDNPAKPDDTDRDFGFFDVSFNKIAVWLGDYEGPEFLIKDWYEDYDTLESDPMAAVPVAGVSHSDDRDSDVDVVDASTQSAEDGAEFMVHTGVMSPDHFLEHYGVKGMRWGVRKAEDGSYGGSAARAAFARPAYQVVPKLSTGSAAKLLFTGPLALTSKKVRDELKKADRDIEAEQQARRTAKKDKKFERKAASGAVRRKVFWSAGENIANDVGRIRDKPEYKGKDLKADAKLKSKYDAEIAAATAKNLTNAANSMTNASVTRQYDVKVNGNRWDVTTRKIKHADLFEDEDDDSFVLIVSRDDLDYITSMEIAEDSVEHASLLELGAGYLISMGLDAGMEHYGVKGMRWGVRRDRPTPTAVAPSAASRVPGGDKRKTKIEVSGGQNHEASSDAIKVAEATAKLKKSGVVALSNQELREVAQRKQLEQQVKMLTASQGQKFINSLLGNTLPNEGQNLARGAVRVGAKTATGGAANAAAKKIIKKSMT